MVYLLYVSIKTCSFSDLGQRLFYKTNFVWSLTPELFTACFSGFVYLLHLLIQRILTIQFTLKLVMNFKNAKSLF